MSVLQRGFAPEGARVGGEWGQGHTGSDGGDGGGGQCGAERSSLSAGAYERGQTGRFDRLVEHAVLVHDVDLDGGAKRVVDNQDRHHGYEDPLVALDRTAKVLEHQDDLLRE